MTAFARLAVGITLCCAVPAAVVAQEGVILGRVTTHQLPDSTLFPVRGATVSLIGTPRSAVTDASGSYKFTRVPEGEVTIRVRLRRHRTFEQAIQVFDRDTTVLDVTLEPDAHMLAPVFTAAPSTDAELFLTKPSVGVTVLGAEAMVGVPRVGEADVIRVAQMLPGVEARNDFGTGLNVRGGEADQNLILLDGYPVYNPFHFGGVFSTFMDATVGGVELMTAAFPARYGGRLSSVLNVQSADEKLPGINTTADVSALGATARTGGVFANERGNWSVAGRRTYADFTTDIFTDNIFPYHFRDLHAHMTYALPRATRVSFTAYDGKDALDANLAAFDTDTAPTRASQGRWKFDWGNRVLGVTVAKDAGSRVTLEQRAFYSSFATTLDRGQGAATDRNDVNDYTLAGSVSLRTASHDPSVGYEVSAHRVRYGSASVQTGLADFNIVQRPATGAVWVEDLWRVTSKWLLQAGVRGEALSNANWAGVSPRVSIKYFATPDLALTVAAGHVTQWLQSLAGDGPYRYFDVWIASDSFIPVSTAWHYAAGVEKRLHDAASIHVEGYLKRYDRVLEANWSEDPQVRGDEMFVAKGLSYGVDLLARWQMRNGAGPRGWVSYSYGLSSRERDGARWAPGHDRRHDVDVVTTWKHRKYQFGARFGFASGTPYTPIVGEIARWSYDPSRDLWNGGLARVDVESLGGARNGARFPATHRLDLDVSRDFTVRGARVAPYVSIVNAYNAKNVFVYLYNYSAIPPTRRALSQFPIIPSVGVRVAF